MLSRRRGWRRAKSTAKGSLLPGARAIGAQAALRRWPRSSHLEQPLPSPWLHEGRGRASPILRSNRHKYMKLFMALGTCLDASSASANQIKAAVNALPGGRAGSGRHVDASFLPSSGGIPLLLHLRWGWDLRVGHGACARWAASRLQPITEARTDARDPVPSRAGPARQHYALANCPGLISWESVAQATLWAIMDHLQPLSPRTWQQEDGCTANAGGCS